MEDANRLSKEDMSYSYQGSYNPQAALNAARTGKLARDEARSDGPENSHRVAYRHVLEWIQNKISNSENYNRILQECLNSDNEKVSEDKLKGLIMDLLPRYPNYPLDTETIYTYAKRIYEDMNGFGILTPYLDDPEVEEINVYGPGPHQIEIVAGKKGIFKLEEGFPDAESVLNITKRMVRKGKMVLDQSSPRVDSYIDSGTRVSAMIPPIVRDDKGAIVSIRKQTKATITRNDLIASKSAAPEELDFIDLCMKNNVSGAVVGPTGSGKTTLLNYAMTVYVNEEEHARVYIIEESRELQLPSEASVFYTAVCGDEKTNTTITADDLLKSALRFHPTFISTAEMRGKEALNAMNAAQTGHVVWSTFHADSGEAAYQRLLTMCTLAGTSLSEELLMRNLVTAFPIIVSALQLKDGTRKITGIYEATGVNGSCVEGHYIYRMMVDHFEYDEKGKVTHVYGSHCRVGDLSDKMAQRIYDNCGRLEDVQRFARKGWMPERNGTSESFRIISSF